MFYRPNFCAECGIEIARARWHAWTSRRFCQVCAGRFRKRTILAASGITSALIIIGFAVGHFTNTTPETPPLVLNTRATSDPTLAALRVGSNDRNDLKNDDTAPDQTARDAVNDGSATGARNVNTGASSGDPNRMTDPEEVVSMCGARTKKGTPCSRRVRGYGRCWQHRGSPAMLPAAKLIIRDQG